MKFDNEYSTQNIDEVNELKRCGIRYTFIKNDNGVTIWKYTKTPKLFEVLKNFYIDTQYFN